MSCCQKFLTFIWAKLFLLVELIFLTFQRDSWILELKFLYDLWYLKTFSIWSSIVHPFCIFPTIYLLFELDEEFINNFQKHRPSTDLINLVSFLCFCQLFSFRQLFSFLAIILINVHNYMAKSQIAADITFSLVFMTIIGPVISINLAAGGAHFQRLIWRHSQNRGPKYLLLF